CSSTKVHDPSSRNSQFDICSELRSSCAVDDNIEPTSFLSRAFTPVGLAIVEAVGRAELLCAFNFLIRSRRDIDARLVRYRELKGPQCSATADSSNKHLLIHAKPRLGEQDRKSTRLNSSHV